MTSNLIWGVKCFYTIFLVLVLVLGLLFLDFTGTPGNFRPWSTIIRISSWDKNLPVNQYIRPGVPDPAPGSQIYIFLALVCGPG